MKLEQQLEIIIKDAPQYGIPSVIMEQGVIPVLRNYGKKLRESEYYILKTAEDQLLLNTLTNISQPSLEKKVIYLFAMVKDGLNFSEKSEQKVYPKPIFVTDILFQLFALKAADSLIFVEKDQRQYEVNRSQLQELVETNLKNLVKPRNIPPNFA
jgi:hypothetical protein